jgi:hypothetical protein
LRQGGSSPRPKRRSIASYKETAHRSAGKKAQVHGRPLDLTHKSMLDVVLKTDAVGSLTRGRKKNNRRSFAPPIPDADRELVLDEYLAQVEDISTKTPNVDGDISDVQLLVDEMMEQAFGANWQRRYIPTYLCAPKLPNNVRAPRRYTQYLHFQGNLMVILPVVAESKFHVLVDGVEHKVGHGRGIVLQTDSNYSITAIGGQECFCLCVIDKGLTKHEQMVKLVSSVVLPITTTRIPIGPDGRVAPPESDDPNADLLKQMSENMVYSTTKDWEFFRQIQLTCHKILADAMDHTKKNPAQPKSREWSHDGSKPNTIKCVVEVDNLTVVHNPHSKGTADEGPPIQAMTPSDDQASTLKEGVKSIRDLFVMQFQIELPGLLYPITVFKQHDNLDHHIDEAGACKKYPDGGDDGMGEYVVVQHVSGLDGGITFEAPNGKSFALRTRVGTIYAFKGINKKKALKIMILYISYMLIYLLKNIYIDIYIYI